MGLLMSHLKKLNWLNMDNRRLLHLYCQIYKINHHLCPDYLYSRLNTRSNIHSYFTRSNQHFNIPYRRTVQSSKSFFYTAPTLYNALPNDIKSATSLKSFKNKCRTLIFTNQCDI